MYQRWWRCGESSTFAVKTLKARVCLCVCESLPGPFLKTKQSSITHTLFLLPPIPLYGEAKLFMSGPHTRRLYSLPPPLLFQGSGFCALDLFSLISIITRIYSSFWPRLQVELILPRCVLDVPFCHWMRRYSHLHYFSWGCSQNI